MLAHELGHGVHAALAARQGIFHQGTPLTLAETASVFGEALTFATPARGLADPAARACRCSPRIVEGAIATVFRQVAMNRFEDRVHTRAPRGGRALGRALRRAVGADPGRASRRLGRAHRRLPLLVVLHPALHQHARATSTRTRTASCSRCRSTSATSRRARGFEQRYVELLAAGGSRSPEELGDDRRYRPHGSRLLGPRPRPRRAARRAGRGGRG